MRIIAPKSVSEIYSYYINERLGLVKCPNGRKLQVCLQHVLKPVFNSFKPNDILSFVGIGSAFRYPRTVTKFKTRMFSRTPVAIQQPEKIKKVQDFDFVLVLSDGTRKSVQKLDADKYRIFVHDDYGGYLSVVHGESQILLTSLQELNEQMNDANNYIHRSILTEGVLLFGDNIQGMRHRREINWDWNVKGKILTGHIKNAPVVACPKCSSETMDYAKFCPLCGHSFGRSS